MSTSDAAFFALELGSGDPNELTPPMGETETGIRIAAPALVSSGGNFTIPITAVARFTTEGRDALPTRLWQSLVVVVWDSTKNLLHAATLGDPSPIPEAEGEPIEGDDEPEGAPAPIPPAPTPPVKGATPAPSPDDDSSESLFDGPDEPLPPSGPPIPLSGGYFTQYRTFDLLEAIDLPPVSARYLLFATYGPHHSNTVRIEVVEPGKQPLSEGKGGSR